MQRLDAALRAALVAALMAPAALPQTPVVAIDCGGPDLVAGGATFLADKPYAPGSFGHVGGSSILTAELRLGPVDSPYEEVVRRARVGFDAYRVDLPNGDYLVRLHLCDIQAHGAGLRRFSLALEGQTVLADVDLAERFGHDFAGVHTSLVTVGDGRLDVEATASVGQTLLSGIEVFALAGAPPQPAGAQGLAAKWSYGANVITWDRDDAPGVLGWRVEAADQPSGPFAPLATLWSQPTSFVDLGAPVGVERHYRVVPLGAAGDGPASVVVSATARDSSQSTLPVYRLTIDPADQRELDALFLSQPDFEIPVTLEHAGVTYAASLRYSGFTSSDDPKKSYKLRFGQGQTFQDRRELNLKSHFSDDTILRQELSRRVYLAATHRAPRATWVHVEVNGEFAGVFGELEVIEEDFLRHRELPDGPIYQAYLNFSASMFPISPTSGISYENAYKKKTEQDQPYADLVQFIEELDQVPNADFRAWIATKLDVDDFLDFWAATCTVADIEKVLRDYHLYLNPDTGRWSVYTWDTDASWKQNFLPYDFGSIPFWVGEHQLAVRVLSDPVWRWQYREKVQALLDGPVDPSPGGAFEQLWDAQMALVETDVLADYRKYGWTDDAPFLDSVWTIKTQARIRHDAIESQFAADPQGKVPHPVWINEVMAANSGSVLDPSGEPADWVELVNVTDTDQDLSGHHLTDDPALPTKWTFPPGSVVPAGGHLVVWCDGDVAQPGLHASFSLARDGEAVALFAPGGQALLDVIHFDVQRSDVSLAREQGPEPGAFWRETADPTPGAANQTPGDLPPDLRLVQHAPSTPSPTDSVRFSAHADDEQGVTVELRYRVNGGPFQLRVLDDLGGGYFETELPPFAAGAQVEYWVRAVDGDGDEWRFPLDAPADLVAFAVVAPAFGGLVVNEVCADNDTLLADGQGQYEDYVELYNRGVLPVDLAGHFLTDDLTAPTKFALPAGTVVPPGGRVLVWCDGDTGDGPLHASFSLSKDGEEVGLFRQEAGGVVLVDGFAFGPAPSDTAVGSLRDGQAPRVRLFDPSPGAPNAPAPGGWGGYDSVLGSGAPLALALSGSLDLGGSFQIASQGAPGNPAVLALCFAPAALELGPGAPLLVDPSGALVLWSATGGSGVVSWPLAVPPLPSLTGLQVFAQALVGPDLTSAVHLVVGP